MTCDAIWSVLKVFPYLSEEKVFAKEIQLGLKQNIQISKKIKSQKNKNKSKDLFLKDVQVMIDEQNITPNVVTVSSMIGLCGDISEAEGLINKYNITPNVVTFFSLLGVACRTKNHDAFLKWINPLIKMNLAKRQKIYLMSLTLFLFPQDHMMVRSLQSVLTENELEKAELLAKKFADNSSEDEDACLSGIWQNPLIDSVYNLVPINKGVSNALWGELG